MLRLGLRPAMLSPVWAPTWVPFGLHLGRRILPALPGDNAPADRGRITVELYSQRAIQALVSGAGEAKSERYGNINTSAHGSYEHLTVGLPGSGDAATD